MVSDAKTMHAFDRNPFSLTQWGYVCFYLTRKPHFFDDVTPKKYLICFLAVIFSHVSVPFSHCRSVFSRVMVQSAPIHWQASTLRKQLNIIAPQRYTGQNHTGSFSTKKVAFCNVYHCRTPLYVNKQLTHGHSLITIYFTYDFPAHTFKVDKGLLTPHHSLIVSLVQCGHPAGINLSALPDKHDFSCSTLQGPPVIFCKKYCHLLKRILKV